MFHILVAEDDKHTQLLFQAVLETNGYTVSLARNGQEALSVMDRVHIDLVILDVMMPVMNGYEFTRLLRESDNNLPILMVSAKQLPEDKHMGFLVGTDDYMTKPIDEEEMLLRIKALLRRAKIANERKIHIGKVCLNYDTLTVSGHGQTASAACFLKSSLWLVIFLFVMFLTSSIYSSLASPMASNSSSDFIIPLL